MSRLIISFFAFLFLEEAFAEACRLAQTMQTKKICAGEALTIGRKCKKKPNRYMSDEITKAQEKNEALESCLHKMAPAVRRGQQNFQRAFRTRFYAFYLSNNKYEKDFEDYHGLSQEIKKRIRSAAKGYNNFFRMMQQARNRNDVNANTERLKAYLQYHPHFQDKSLPTEYARALSEAKKRKAAFDKNKCDPEKAPRCSKRLLAQLEEDSKTGPQYYCRKVLQEGQACCSAPNKSCGNFTFAKEITSTFAKSVPGLLSSFAQFRGLQGNPQAACKLSALGNVIAPVGQLQIKSCNKALEGCRETCNKRIKGFKAAFRSCFNIKKGEIAKVIRKARGDKAWEEPEDPHKECGDKIKEIAEAYKKITIEQKISLRDSSDHEDLIACRSGIERYAPSKGRGVLPAQQLAVNICYDKLRRQHPNIPSPPRLPAASPPKGPPLNAGNFAGSVPKTNISSYSPPEVKAPADDGDSDFLDKNPDSSRFSPAGFSSPSASPGGSGGSPAGGSGSSGGGSSESPENGGEEGDYSGLSPTEGFGFAPGEGGEEGGKDPWAEGGADGKGGGQGQGQGQARTLEEELEELKKLPDEYLDLKEKDLIRAMTPPGKHENIFEYHTFFLNWYCRTYGGCGDYFRSMGFPSHLKPEKPRLLKVYDKELRERGARALSPRNPRNENRKADKDQR